MFEKIKPYTKQIAIAIVVVVVVVVVYLMWKRSADTTIKVVDDRGNPVTFTQAEKQQAGEIAARIYNDINSGWAFGYNFWGNIGRDEAVYDEMMGLSDTLFSLTCSLYKDKYDRSLISDLRDEISLGTETRGLILQRAQRLNIA